MLSGPQTLRGSGSSGPSTLSELRASVHPAPRQIARPGLVLPYRKGTASNTPRAKKRGPPASPGAPYLRTSPRKVAASPNGHERRLDQGPPVSPGAPDRRTSPRKATAVSDGHERRLDPGISLRPWRLIALQLPDRERPPTDPRPRPTVDRATQTEDVVGPPSPPLRTPTRPRTPGRPGSPVIRLPHTPARPRTPGRPGSPVIRFPRSPGHSPSAPAPAAKRSRPSESSGRFEEVLRRITQASPDRTRLRSVVSIPLQPIPCFRRRPFVQDRTKALFELLGKENRRR
ncbi:PREDICTED: cuticle collagen 1-like [Wasmannia auropunctata]|uniref:cuticle collagen 1-like n=1 Tax=Wasmannia auropunctata TaxID=64793 RepID=UPI0005EF9C56|nr:PREDICTED: cuticle collagen 1-like [Wasmannia auropunctata]